MEAAEPEVAPDVSWPSMVIRAWAVSWFAALIKATAPSTQMLVLALAEPLGLLLASMVIESAEVIEEVRSRSTSLVVVP